MKDFVGVFFQEFACRSDGKRVSSAIEKNGACLALELGYVLADGRLAHAKSARGSREASELSDGHKNPQSKIFLQHNDTNIRIIFYICDSNQNHFEVKKTILIAVLICLFAGIANAQTKAETVRTDKVYVSLGAGTQISLNLRFIDAGGQFELGWWFSPITAIAVNAGGNLIVGRNTAGADEIFAGKEFDLQARILGLLEFTNLFLGDEEGARARFHVAGYAGLGKIVNEVPTAGSKYYWLPSIGVDLSDRISQHTSMFLRAGVNLYHPIRNLTVYPEASIGLRFGLGKGRTYDKDPHQAYKDNIAALEQELEKERNKVKTDTVVVTETKEVEVEKLVRDTVLVKVNQVDTLTIYDVVEVGNGAPVKADTVFVKDTIFVDSEPIVKTDTILVYSQPEILVKTVYVDSVGAPAADSVYTDAVAQVDTVYIVSEPEVQIQVQKDTIFVPTEPEIMVRTVYVNKEPIILKDTVFVATDPEVQIQTVYRDKEPIILVDTVFVQSDPEIEIRTVYRDREIVKVQTDTVFVASEPEVQIQVQVQKDTVFVPSDPTIQTDTVFVDREIAGKIDTVLVEKDPIVQIDTVVIEKDPVIQIDTVVVEKDPIVQIDTVVVEKDPIVQVDTVIVNVPVEPESTIIYVLFPENAAWVNYGARKQLDKISKEIKEYDGGGKYLLIAPVSPDSEDPVKAYNLGVRRVSQVRLHLIRENGVDSRKLQESVIVSPAGIAVEDGNAFVIVAREDDPRISEILGQ